MAIQITLVSYLSSSLRIFADRAAGGTSGFSIFPRQSLRLISEITGSNELADIVSKVPYLDESIGGMNGLGPSLWHARPEKDHEPLPPRELADAYINCKFR